MPQIGDIKKSGELGYKGNNYEKWIWAACIDCGRERWVPFRKGKPESIKCHHCAQKGKHPSVITRIKMSQSAKGKQAGEKNPAWKGGRIQCNGYVLIKLHPDDFFYSMVQEQRYVMEHRLIMAKHLGRCLHRWEIVHHKNHIKDDNRIENLQLISDDRHKQISLLERRVKHLEDINRELGIEIIKLGGIPKNVLIGKQLRITHRT